MKPLAFLPLAILAGCATTPLPPTEVLRYHLPDGVPRGTVAVEPGGFARSSGPFEDAVGRQLAGAGYSTTAAGGPPSLYVATVDVRQRERDAARRSPVSVGIGAGGSTGGYRSGVGLGGGISFPIGGRRGPLLDTELNVLIKRRADQATVWEGHARGVDDPGRKGATEGGFADRLAAALFTGFPGESGRTISVP